MVCFLKFVISVRDGHCDYSPLAPKKRKKSYATEHFSGLFPKGVDDTQDIYFNFLYTNCRMKEEEREVFHLTALSGAKIIYRLL